MGIERQRIKGRDVTEEVGEKGERYRDRMGGEGDRSWKKTGGRWR